MKKSLLYLSFFSFLLLISTYLLIAQYTAIPEENFEQAIESAKIKNKNPLKFSILETGFSEVPEAFAFQGGSFLKNYKLKHHAVLVQHPKATFLFDTGLGEEVYNQVERLPVWVAMGMKFTKTASVKKQLEQKPELIEALQFILVSHLHWDHTSGLVDFPKLQVYVSAQEHDWYLKEGSSYLSGILSPVFFPENISWYIMNFKKKNYEGFEHSLDLFEDGSVVLVLMPGHSPGSVGMFLNLAADKRYFFIGDCSFKIDPKGRATYKSKLARLFSDEDIQTTAMQIKHINRLLELQSQIKVLPSHDQSAYEQLKHWPAWNE